MPVRCMRVTALILMTLVSHPAWPGKGDNQNARPCEPPKAAYHGVRMFGWRQTAFQ